MLLWSAPGLGAIAALARIFSVGDDLARLIDRRINRVEAEEPPAPPTSEARAFHQSLFVADLHADTMLWPRDPQRRIAYGHVDLPRLRAGNVALQAFTVVTQMPADPGAPDAAEDDARIAALVRLQGWPAEARTSLLARALVQAERLRRLEERERADHGERAGFMLLRSAADLAELQRRRQRQPGLVGGFLGLEGAHALEGRADNLDRLHAAGFRMIAPTHRFDNDMGGSSEGHRRGGLTPLGVAVFERAFDLRMAIDLAHASAAVIDDIVAMALERRVPVLISHTGFKAMHPAGGDRNVTDEQLRQIARTGGVVGVGFWPQAIGRSSVEAIADAIQHALRALDDAALRDWMTARYGRYDPADHIALGSDFDGLVTTPIDAAGLVHITDALLRRGLPPGEIAQIMGGNVLRVLQEVWGGTAVSIAAGAAAPRESGTGESGIGESGIGASGSEGRNA
jgi:microsomal dipeptidase-like Zn-dependent dipeptidase